jgi:hypothetical protein
MTDPYPRGDWERHRDRRRPYSSGGAWNQSRDQAPSSGYWDDQPSFPFDWQHAATPHRPRSVQAAVVLMCVGAGLSALDLIYDLIGGPWGAAGYGAIPRGASPLVDVASTVSSVGSAVGAVVGIVLWLFMASAAGAGSSWARTAATVLVVIGTVSLAVFYLELRPYWHLGSGQGLLSSGALIAVLLPALVFWFLRLAIVVLLWRQESSAYFRAKAVSW